MKYLLALLTLCVISGCAHKQRVQATPGHAIRHGCREVSIDARTGETTVICPPEVKK